MQLAGPLDGQGMHRHAVRREALDHVQRVLEVREALPRQRRDDVHVDVVEAQGAGQLVGRDRLRAGVGAADAPKGRVAEGLGVHGDPAHPVVLQHPQLLPVDGVGPPGLHRPLHGPRKGVLGRGQDALQIAAGDGRGRAAADVPGPQAEPLLRHQFLAQRDLPQHRFHVGRDHFAVADLPRRKRAVGAAGFAEGDADVQVEPIRRGLADARLHLRDLPQQRRLLRAHVVGRLHVRHGLIQRKPRLHALVQEARGADTGETAPGGPHPGQFLEQVVQRQLHLPLAQPLDLQRRSGHRRLAQPAGLPLGGPGVRPQAARVGKAVLEHRLALGEAHLHVPIKQPQHVAQVGEELRRVGDQPDHSRYLARSRAMVVGPPWPGQTRVSPGSANSAFSEESICRGSPPCRSTRP